MNYIISSQIIQTELVGINLLIVSVNPVVYQSFLASRSRIATCMENISPLPNCPRLKELLATCDLRSRIRIAHINLHT